MKIALLAVALLLSLNSYAGNKPPGFDPVKWDKIVNHIFEKGEVNNIAAGELRSLRDIHPADTSQSHRAEYLSLLGNYTNFAQYIPQDVSAVDEEWQTENGEDWVIDQWHYHVSPAGDLREISHQRLVEHNGRVLEYKIVPVGPAEAPEQLKKWAAKLEQWYKAAGI